MPIEEVLVLASSRKHGGRCIAGLNKAGDWVRPVSRGPYGLFKAECGIDGRWPEVLDVVRFGYSERPRVPAQPENVLIDGSEWELSKRLDPPEAEKKLRRYLTAGPALLGNRGSAVKGEIAAQGVEASLALLEPRSEIEFVLGSPEEGHGKPRPRVSFALGSRGYELPVTDIPVEEAMREVGAGTYKPEDLGFDAAGTVFLTVSLGEEYEGWHYKLVAAVLFLPQASEQRAW